MTNEAEDPPPDRVTNVVNGDMFGVQAGTIHGGVHYHQPAEADDDVPEVFDHVPGTKDEIDYVITHQVWSWQYLLYAGVLQVGLRDIKRRRAGKQASTPAFANKDAAIRHVSTLMSELTSIVDDFKAGFDVGLMSRAFGEPGRPGEWRLVNDIARRQVAAYEKMQAWSVSVREAKVPRQARRLYEVASQVADQPMRDIETFVERLASGLNSMLKKAALDITQSHRLSVTCDLTLDDKVMTALNKEISRAKRRW